ncbi:hypothetical protein DFJ58DRAFT_845023 [Suillus subalutaceus]|uniref:uncharacterized protein n=1 Tax=Suillus subalutaceus TaxID=48586 RepID=UPI001B87E5C7|nr:uncharacterized protein DFJ58DRAFT_845023 [Suillus subalutaceus]KAG1841446.1 hypothetical protein DFJ58DRAFT_845023 [Suillus subalutaceus]
MSSNSNASSATIVAVTVFEQGRKAEGSTLFFDAQIYLGPDCPVLIAAMRFFTVAQMESGAHIMMPEGMRESDYDLVADVVSLIPLPDGVDLLHSPYIEICGTVHSVDDLAGTFNIDAHQYIASLRIPSAHTEPPSTSSSPATKTFKSIMPVECSIPDTPRWKRSGKKLTPQPHRYVSITGFLTGRKTKTVVGEDPVTERFCLQVDSIVFLGRPVVAHSSSNSVASNPSTPATGRSKMKFDFSQVRSNKRARLDE